ncbi:inner membrane protein YiaA [Amantichitinum ursilacus]|uniref:Inner membrane protein YiaA n=1 Tax=Amantichitinum ursilacus TaxID=857265 RepID=A0A0N0GQW0_9NEIS|nr:inner membrane protein YiaA [Amantichitinum ursilacus]KPC55101.1 Inner membrane protein YiaA [Amantichitinum ursilacus]
MNSQQHHNAPTGAFIAASWVALLLGMGAYLLGLWNGAMQLNERGYYLVVMLYGLYSAISIQKSVRDRQEGIPVTAMYYGLSWFSVLTSVSLLGIGLYNASLQSSEKGFYAMAFTLALFGAIAVQKNTRDLNAARALRSE